MFDILHQWSVEAQIAFRRLANSWETDTPRPKTLREDRGSNNGRAMLVIAIWTIFHRPCRSPDFFPASSQEAVPIVLLLG